jgi:hypothetical protein
LDERVPPAISSAGSTSSSPRKILKQFRRNYTMTRTDSAHDGIRKYRASQNDCQACELKAQCCLNMASRNVLRSVHEEARD